jgi:hypothetical protein
MKIRTPAAELFQRDGRTDITKLIVAFISFAKVTKNFGTGQRRMIVFPPFPIVRVAEWTSELVWTCEVSTSSEGRIPILRSLCPQPSLCT